VSGKGYVPSLGELRFDVFEAEVTHTGGVGEVAPNSTVCRSDVSHQATPLREREE
jgi:hypothetical protein